VQLAEWKDAFEGLGIAVAGMTYDDVAILTDFAAEHDLGYPLLSDVDARTVTAWGILNEAYGPGERNHGLPHPGVVWIDGDGRVAAKWAVPGYRERPAFEDVIAEVRTAMERR
jgi:peroxiredoxin Q/BCP